MKEEIKAVKSHHTQNSDLQQQRRKTLFDMPVEDYV